MPHQYFFDGVERFAFIWDNPNYAGVVFATLIPLLWELGQKARHTVTILIFTFCEVALFTMVCLTYSRGALLGLAAGFFYYITLCENLRKKLPLLLLRFVSYSALVLAGGAGKRILQSADDMSVLNRFTLWKGGSVLFDANTWLGWGGGMSGIAYREWVQDTTSNLSYSGMVNSYLTVAVEHGAIALFLLLFAIIFLLLKVQMLNRHNNAKGLPGLGASVASFAVASCFSTFFHRMDVIVIPLAIAAILLFLIIRVAQLRNLLKSFVISGICTVILVLALKIAGTYFNNSGHWKLVYVRHNEVHLINTEKNHICTKKTELAFLPTTLR